MVETTLQTTTTRNSAGREFVQQSPSDIDIKTATLDRPTGFLENWFSHYKFSLVTAVHFSCKKPHVVQEKQEEEEEQEEGMDLGRLKQACALLSDKHPLLKCNMTCQKFRRNCFQLIEHEENRYIEPRFMSHEKLMTKLDRNRDNVSFSDYNPENAWKWLIEKEMNVNFDLKEERPLWRLTLLQWRKPVNDKDDEQQMKNEDTSSSEYFMFITIPAAISDLISMYRIVADLFHFYDRLSEDKDFKVQPLPMLVDAEQLYFMSNETMDERYVAEKARESLEQFLQYSPRIQLAQPGHVQHIYHHCKPLVAVGEENSYTQLKSKLEELPIRSSVHCDNALRSVSIACAFLTLAKYQYRDPDVSPTTLPELESCVDYMISVRNLVRPSVNNDHLGLLSGMIRFHQTTTPNVKFWDFCRCVLVQLDESMRMRDPVYWHAIQRNMDHDSTQFVEHLKQCSGRYGDMVMSDTGGAFRIVSPHFNVESVNTLFSNKPTGWGFSLNLNRMAEKVCYSWSFDSILVDKTYATTVFEHFVNMMENAHAIDAEATIGDVLYRNCRNLL